MKNILFGVVAVVMLSTSVAGAAVYSPQQQLPTSVVEVFKATPTDILKQYPDGGAPMISRVRDLAASDPSTLQLLVNLLKGPLTPSQQTAIATGLAQVARLAVRTDQPYYTEIQEAVAKSGNKEASDLYAALTGNLLGTGAGGGGGAGGAGGGGGSGTGGSTGTSGFVFGGNNSGTTTFGARNYTNPQPQLTSAGFGGAGSSVSPGLGQ